MLRQRVKALYSPKSPLELVHPNLPRDWIIDPKVIGVNLSVANSSDSFRAVAGSWGSASCDSICRWYRCTCRNCHIGSIGWNFLANYPPVCAKKANTNQRGSLYLQWMASTVHLRKLELGLTHDEMEEVPQSRSFLWCFLNGNFPRLITCLVEPTYYLNNRFHENVLYWSKFKVGAYFLTRLNEGR